ncbi:hypothetical protein ACQR35_06725 [Pseudarthrobacter sp. J1738]|uniref:hypothetical protein n=1 Tax=Pseudarthrobacter sp. J1738 TaxID=3420446 RepID=UPI003D2CD853
MTSTSVPGGKNDESNFIEHDASGVGAEEAADNHAEPLPADAPVLLFLHGVGDGDPDNNWRPVFDAALTEAGYPNLDEVRVIAPKFAHALVGSDDREAVPCLTIKVPTRDEAKTNRRRFENRMRAAELRFGGHERGSGIPGLPAAISASVDLPSFKAAQNYLHVPHIRAQVLNRILRMLPREGRLVIVGHSLGSVIAVDLLRRLPPQLHVTGLVTIGSPLATKRFHVDNLQDVLAEPPSNLGWWVNFWNPADPVAGRRGVSSAFPWMVDLLIPTKKILHQAHSATEYLAQPAVADAVGYALFGSKGKEVATTATGFDIPLDPAEIYAVVALRFAHLVAQSLTGDLGERYSGALRTVQALSVVALQERIANEKRLLPAAVAQLSFDFSDLKTPAPIPQRISGVPKDMAVVLFTVLGTENVIHPFEITVSKSAKQQAMEELSAEMGFGIQFGRDVFTAANTANTALSGPNLGWIKWGALGAGATAIVLATGGLALAAAPGLAGAALITSALASFGPGGMVGGLLTAGTLMSAGGGGVAFGLASNSTSAETVEAVVVRQLAAVVLRKLQGLSQDDSVWNQLTTMELDVRREYERADEFSDASSPMLKEIKKKIAIIERAINYLKDNNLEPEDSLTIHMDRGRQ